MKEITDDTILTLLQNTTTYDEGFRVLMVKYQEPLYRHIRRYVIDHDDADDVVQNTFIKIYKGIDRFEGKSKLYTWLYRIATNEALTFVQNRQRKVTADIENPTLNIANTLRADVFFDGDEIQIKLQAAISTLPEKQRLVFNMRYFDELSYEQISEILGTSIGALKASFHHAVKKIEVCLIT